MTEKYAAECDDTARKLSQLFNPRTRIPWGTDRSVIVLGVLNPAKALHVTLHERVQCDVPDAKMFVHSDGGATTFVFPAGSNFVNNIDAVFRVHKIECVTVSTSTQKIPGIRIPKTVAHKQTALSMPPGLTNAEAYVVATKTIDSMTAVLDALVDRYIASGPAPRGRKWTHAMYK